MVELCPNRANYQIEDLYSNHYSFLLTLVVNHPMWSDDILFTPIYQIDTNKRHLYVSIAHLHNSFSHVFLSRFLCNNAFLAPNTIMRKWLGIMFGILYSPFKAKTVKQSKNTNNLVVGVLVQSVPHWTGEIYDGKTTHTQNHKSRQTFCLL